MDRIHSITTLVVPAASTIHERCEDCRQPTCRCEPNTSLTALAAAVGETLSLEDLADTVICPTCHVAAGARCITRAGKPARESHGRRFEAMEQAAGITQHRATARREKQARGYTSNGLDHKAEAALLTAYAARINARASLDDDQALAADVREILRAAADRLTAMNPDTTMSRAALRTEVQLSVWDHHGTYNNTAVGRDITAVLAELAHIPLSGTRAAYAQRMREQYGAVTH